LITDEREPAQSEIGKAFVSLQSRFEDKLRFVKLDWNSEEGREAIAQTGLKNPPISVLISSDGEVKDKFEGNKSSREISKKLDTLVKTSASN